MHIAPKGGPWPGRRPGRTRATPATSGQGWPPATPKEREWGERGGGVDGFGGGCFWVVVEKLKEMRGGEGVGCCGGEVGVEKRVVVIVNLKKKKKKVAVV